MNRSTLGEGVRRALTAIAEGRAVDLPDLAEAANVSRATIYRAAGVEFEVIEIGSRKTVPPHEARRVLCLPAQEAA